jgi:hypothetical protein
MDVEPNESLVPGGQRVAPPKPRRRRRNLPTTPRAIEKYRKVQLAMKLRYSGMGWRDIAEQLGYKSHTGIHADVHKLLGEEIDEDVEALRQRELGTLDLMQQELMKAVLAGQKWAPRAAEVIVKLMERRAALAGLDSAEKHELKVTGPQVVEYLRDDRQESHRAQLAEVLKGTALESLYAPPEVIDAEFSELPPALPPARSPDPGP